MKSMMEKVNISYFRRQIAGQSTIKNDAMKYFSSSILISWEMSR
jgi:hypothetical protein